MKTKTTKRHIINEQYSLVIEIDITRTIMWIEEKRKWLLFSYFERVSSFVFLDLSEATFNLKRDIYTLYTSCLKSRSDRLKQAKQIDIILNQLD